MTSRSGNQVAGRVGFFLRVEDFDVEYARMVAAGVTFVTSPRRAVQEGGGVPGHRRQPLGPA